MISTTLTLTHYWLLFAGLGGFIFLFSGIGLVTAFTGIRRLLFCLLIPSLIFLGLSWIYLTKVPELEKYFLIWILISFVTTFLYSLLIPKNSLNGGQKVWAVLPSLIASLILAFIIFGQHIAPSWF